MCTAEDIPLQYFLQTGPWKTTVQAIHWYLVCEVLCTVQMKAVGICNILLSGRTKGPSQQIRLRFASKWYG
jgi:hypothetical protein